ncbi:condensin complex subunit 1 isoform X2 [Venturia canescens]|uniref:condensin complex subunit 1 isoform X2 n=1 Tax=Venturia canescens TaxID=32260 RepID=UPI001C9C1CFF|nr:condensin complex subunit 1 isoform X2 [Venturia canescens]
MEIKEFSIPLDKDELLRARASSYSVIDIVPSGSLAQALDATRPALQKDGPKFILNHFDTFFSVIMHGKKVHSSSVMRAFDRILKATSMLIEEMEVSFDKSNDILTSENRPLYLCINKMYAYLLSSLACYIEDDICKNSDSGNIGRKKKTKSDAEEEWEIGKQKALEIIYRWLQLPLHKLWTPPIVEDLFVTVLAQFCYKVLEQNRDARQKDIRETIFKILGTLVKRYNQGITCVVRIIQLVKLYDGLCASLAAGVVHMVSSTGCVGFIKEMVCEIGQSEPGEADARNISTFLETIASSRADLILPILDDIAEHLTSESYSMRNCVLGVLGAAVLGALTGDDLDDKKKEQRDDCLRNLEEHILDCNAYVRSKCLQIWQRLCCQGAVPLQRQCSLLNATALRLEDKSANVRKQALQLLRALLQGNPFAAKLDQTNFNRQLEEATTKMRELQVAVASSSTRGDPHRLELWKVLMPEIQKAISKIAAEKSDDEEDEEDEDSDRRNEIDPDAAFEKVRRLLLEEKVEEAVTYLKKICHELPGAADMSNMNVEGKENCFFLFLFKIFVECEDGQSDHENEDPQKSGRTEAQNSAKNKELKQRKEELKTQKRLVKYLTNCLDFARQLENIIPFVENLLFSTTAGDAVEACTFLGTAYQFGVPKAVVGVRKALFQVMSRDQSVRNNVASVYKEIYLEMNEPNQSSRQKSLNSVNGLIELLKGLEPGQSPALAQLITTWCENKALGAQELQIMWEKFSMKIPDTRPEESRAALALLTMVASTEPSLLSEGNLDVVVKVGLGARAKEDFLLARDSCRALLKIRQSSNDPKKTPIKFHNDHQMFQEIISLIKDNFTSTKDDGYISFVTDAINVVYHLANKPDELMKSVLLDITTKSNLFMQQREERLSQEVETENLTQDNGPSVHLLSRLLYIVGHIAIRQMVYLDNAVYKELKRRNAVRDLKKGNKSRDSVSTNPSSNPGSTPLNATRKSTATPASARQTLRNREQMNSTTHEDNGEEALEGATADDADAEFVIAALENDIVNGNGILAKYVPIILDVCRHPEKYNDEQLQAYAVLALSKMMTVSSSFCVESLQLLVTIMERSPYPGIRANVLVGMCDLTTRFPNQVEPWTGHIYGRLRDDSVKVRRTCVRMLSNLIMREMIRVKGQVSELALTLMDSDEQIRAETKQFFKDLSNKGNALYNSMPDILSRLTDPELNLEENDFQDILKYILGLMQSQRQIDTIIEKLCSRFILATTERQWRDLSYCLSLLQFSGKSIRKLTESLPLLKDKIHHNSVQKSLNTIIEHTKKKVEAKAACIELEEKIQELLKTTEAPSEPLDDRQAMPPPPVPKLRKPSRRQKTRRHSSSDEENEEDNINDDDDDNDLESGAAANNKRILPSRRSKTRNGNLSRVADSSSESEDGEEEEPVSYKTPRKASKTPRNSEKRKKPTEPLTPMASKTKRNRQQESPAPASSPETTPRRTSTRTKRTISKLR